MKNYPKFVSVVLSILCAALLLFGVFGYSTVYGDITTTKAAEIGIASRGLGLERYTQLVYSFTANASDEDLSVVREVLRARLESAGLGDSAVYCDKEGKSVVVELPWGSRSDWNANTVFTALGMKGQLELRAGREKDANGAPAGITASTVIATNEGLNTAVASSETYFNSMIRYDLQLLYGGAAKKAIAAYTEEALKKGNTEYSVWVDGTMLSGHVFASPIKDGKVAAGDSNYTYSGSGIPGYAHYGMALSGGVLPFALRPEIIYYFGEPDPGVNFRAVLAGLGILAALCAVYWTVRYKALGVCSAFTAAGLLGLLCIFVSGSFYSAKGIPVTAAGLGGFAAAVCAALLCLFSLQETVSGLCAVQSPARAVDAALKNRTAGLLSAGALLLAVTVLTRLLPWMGPEVFDVLHALSVTFCTQILLLFLVFRPLCKSAASFRKLGTTAMFGGKKA